MIGIYQIVNSQNGKRYIGSSVRVEARWSEHRRRLGRGIHHSDYLQHAWNLYGSGVFYFELLEETSRESLLVREQHWIDHYEASRLVYNVSLIAGASTRGRTLSKEHRANVSKALKGRPWTPARRAKAEVSPETRAKQSAVHKGRPWTEARRIADKPHSFTAEARAKLTTRFKGKPLAAATRLKLSIIARNRPPISAEIRAKMSAASKGRPKSPEHRAKLSLNLQRAREAQRASGGFHDSRAVG